jgi:hypothetical protein
MTSQISGNTSPPTEESRLNELLEQLARFVGVFGRDLDFRDAVRSSDPSRRLSTHDRTGNDEIDVSAIKQGLSKGEQRRVVGLEDRDGSCGIVLRQRSLLP